MGIDNNASVRRDAETFEAEYKVAGCRTGSFTLGGDGRTVIGFRVRSNWNDDSNGWFRVVDGGVGQCTVTVEFSSYKIRGCSWFVEAWSV